MIAELGNAAAPRAPNFDHVKSKFRLHLLSKGFGRKAAGRLVSFVRFPSHAAAHPFDLLLVRVNGRMRVYMNGGRLPHQLLITPLNIRFTSIAHGFRFLSASLTCMQPPSTKPAAASRSSTHPAHDDPGHVVPFGHFCPVDLPIRFRTEFRFYVSQFAHSWRLLISFAAPGAVPCSRHHQPNVFAQQRCSAVKCMSNSEYCI